MLHRLQRHPIAVRAFFDFTLALTFAVPAEALGRLLIPGVALDEYEGSGFLAIAMVQTRQMRPEPLPKSLGGSFFLAGYRLLVRYRTSEGQRLRGLQVIRSDTNRRAMTVLGNLFTHYHYSFAEVQSLHVPERLEVNVTTPGGMADLTVTAHLRESDGALPAGSPFPDARTARRFAGPMPFTFSYERETRSIVRIEGQRQEWHPRLVEVELTRASFLESVGLADSAKLASAFYVANVPYRWDRGIVEPLRFGNRSTQ